MKRKEEIAKACIEYYQTNCANDVGLFEAFEEGAKWADKTMIDKARQWFNLHFRQVCTPREIKHDFESKEKMWKSFTQFMEE